MHARSYGTRYVVYHGNLKGTFYLILLGAFAELVQSFANLVPSFAELVPS